jgi:hypothetical protein
MFYRRPTNLAAPPSAESLLLYSTSWHVVSWRRTATILLAVDGGVYSISRGRNQQCSRQEGLNDGAPLCPRPNVTLLFWQGRSPLLRLG